MSAAKTKKPALKEAVAELKKLTEQAFEISKTIAEVDDCEESKCTVAHLRGALQWLKKREQKGFAKK